MSARFSRGSSVLAALILVVLVGGIALAINTIAGPTNPRAFTATVDAPYSDPQQNAGNNAAAKEFSSSAPKSCDEAKQAALGKVFGPDVINTNNGQSGTMDSCFGAFAVSGKPSNNTNDYQCTGRAGSADFGSGSVTVKTSVSKLAAPGKCIIAVCQNGKCSGAKQFEGVNLSKYVPDSSNPTSALVQNDGTNGAYTPYYDPTNPQLKGLTEAFEATPQEAQKALVDQQIINNDRYAEQLREYINSCTSAENCQVDSSMQDISDREQQNAALKEQSDKLAGEIKTLTPGTTGSTDPGVANAAQIAELESRCATYCDAKDAATLAALKNGGPSKYGSGGSTNSFGQPTNGGQPGGGPGGTGGQPEQQSGGGLGSLGNILQSMLGGLAKALGGGAGGAGSANCTTDQNQYQQQQQQYQQQMTLYNQQLQQYNYQAQIAQMQGYPPPPPPQPPQQPCFNQSSNPVQCSTSPAQPTSGCTNGTWKPTTQSGNSCISGWQCVPTGSGGGNTPPTAQLSCQPQVADVGMTIAISYSCGNATGSAGQGFDTGNALSGSATTTLSNPPAGATKATYGLQCVNGTIPATASCSVDISRPSIILVANPKVVAVNASSTIGWLTTGMKSCVVSSPDMPEFTAQNALNTSVNGMAITPALTETSVFLLRCTTQGGQTKDATTTVQVGAPAGGSDFTVSTTADGGAVARGGTMSITWDATASSTNDSAVSLWLYDVELDEDVGLIARDKAASGSYTWTLPAAGSACPVDTPYVCGANLVPGRAYSIDAAIYTPKNAYLGGYPPPNPIQPTYLGYGTSDTFTISQ